jgi:hypothetical protein
MTRYLLETLLHLVILAPAAWFLLRERSIENYVRLAIFGGVYVVYQMLLVLPRLAPAFNITEGRWNWDGKFYGIIWGIAAYFVFRKYFRENDFVKFRQDKSGFKPALIACAVVVALATGLGLIGDREGFSAETLAFQLTMPAIDEELMFRGILLGLPATALRDKLGFLGSPAVWLTAILFGFVHALTLDKDLSPGFEPFYFVQTGLGGLIWAWATLKSRSILFATLSHGLANFLAALVTMIR